ncbi:BON domain-containing protein [Legionella taurinensis]|uniref:BON domain-containing protein n=2 Tax=Legionella taurinensis TaxID=70611 RepID=A0A3A5LWR0_9GAMM|nr:BON domain-containing protein [Legionella taurinensis]RJT65888.1 BON domain-containing protein [Legionella taurinensis]
MSIGQRALMIIMIRPAPQSIAKESRMLNAITKGVFYTVFGTLLVGCYYQKPTYYEPNQPVNSATSMTHGQVNMSDQMITNQVIKRIGNRNIFGHNGRNTPLHIMTRNGVVYVSGSVDTAQERSRIIQVASSVHGVKIVKSSLKINS